MNTSLPFPASTLVISESPTVARFMTQCHWLTLIGKNTLEFFILYGKAIGSSEDEPVASISGAVGHIGPNRTVTKPETIAKSANGKVQKNHLAAFHPSRGGSSGSCDG